MFEARLLQAKLLKQLVDAMKEVVEQANLDCYSTGVSLQGMDTSNVALVILFLRAQGFDQYRADRNISLGVNLNNVSKILKCASQDDIVTLKADDAADHLTLMFENKDQDKISDFELTLMDIDSEQLGIPPDLQYDATIKMNSGEFHRIIRDLSTIGETITIRATKDGVKFSVKGELGSGNIMCKTNKSADKDDSDCTQVEIQQPVCLEFALRYLNTFTKAKDLSETVQISLSDKQPMIVEYNMGDMGYVRYYLAPKVEDDNDNDNEETMEKETPEAPPTYNEEEEE